MVNIGQKYQKRGLTEKKRDEIKNPYLDAHLHINMNSHIYFQENPSSGLGGVAITNFVKRDLKGALPCNKGPDQETVKYVFPFYFLRSTYSPSFMNLILRFDVLRTEVL